MKRRIRAQVLEYAGDFQRDRVRLALVEEGYDGDRFLLSDGTWSETVPEMQEIPTLEEGVELGIRLPAAALEEVVHAIERYRGAAMHGPTEAKVLREALEVERARVDRTLERPPHTVYVDPRGIRTE